MRYHSILSLCLFACQSSTKEPDTEEEVIQDADADGFNAEEDCDDNNSLISPAAEEVCDGTDNNCDGDIDEGVQTEFYADSDLDGFGNPNLVTSACEAPDGFVTNGSDCDDTQALSYPGAEEICDELDNNCDGETDEGLANIYYTDTDGDGFGDPTQEVSACQIAEGLSTLAEDCDDNNIFINPLADEICDGIDNNCDEQIDEGLLITFYEDVDGDGFGNPNSSVTACTEPTGYAENGEDCDDLESYANPSMTEVCDGIDNNCDGNTDESTALDALEYYTDADGDGFGAIEAAQTACVLPTGTSPLSNDCDDNEAAAHPSNTEVCDGIDNNCDGDIDESGAAGEVTYYTDADEDGFGDSDTMTVGCNQPAGTVLQGGDCNDSEATANPAMIEICDTIDNNCDGDIDEDSALDVETWYLDDDEDGFGDASNTVEACEAPTGYTDDDTDCDDTDETIYAGAEEICDGIDNDCDSTTEADAGCTFASCLELQQVDATATSGIYSIDPDGTGAVDTVCDMSHDGGGWTLILHLNDPSGFSEDDFLSLFGDPLFTDHDWRYNGGVLSAGVQTLDDTHQGAIQIDRFSGLWTDVRMACHTSNLSTTEEHYAQVDDYTVSNGNYALLGSTSNGTSYTVNSAYNSFGLSTIWHDNETDSLNSGHYHCDVTNYGPGTSQFGFCYTDFLNNNNSLDYGDSIVSLGFGNALGSDGWSTGFSGECGNMGTGYLNNGGTYWIWI
ncbi:MAG: MopE-related protein, partial [Myxococcota bacterium]|nr:MopE-related protein [Myxococcota bacterium]